MDFNLKYFKRFERVGQIERTPRGFLPIRSTMKIKFNLLLACGLMSLGFVPLACAQTPAAQVANAPQTASYSFVYRADKKLDSVNLAGTFNNWNKTATPLKADADGLTWRVTLPLELGTYQYKFVANGANWVSDPTTKAAPDGSGNSLLTLTAAGNASRFAGEFTPGNADKVKFITPDTLKNADGVPHEFVYRAAKKLDSVNVAGEFNGWNKDANPLQADADGLTWRTSVPLSVGSYQYKFVLDGANWVVDPANERKFVEADGNANSLLLLMPPDYKMLASPADGDTALSALHHEQSVPYLNYDRGQLSFELRARPRDLSAVWLQTAGKRVPMKLAQSDEIYAYYRTEIPWDKKTNLSYDFVLQDGARAETFGAKGLNSPAPFQLDAQTYQPFVVPSWVEKTVFYQIFPDRFENGDKTNDPPHVAPWNSAPTGDSRFGGDIAGVKQHLPYLKNLGIGSVYFNPVFQSPSNHRYDATDFKVIDPQFGTNAQFAALTREMQNDGIRTVMDFVFNHTATNFAPFADVVKNGSNSPYKDWYLIKSFPVRVANPPNYVGWSGYAAMPKLNLTNPATADYMLGLVDFWKREVPLSGIRLDVADEVDIRFWRQLRARVKGLDPQMWMVGERWSDASPWLRGDQWDAAMNYPFLFANVDFFADGKTSSSQFTARLMELYNAYPPQVSRAMLNLLSSHDRPRFLTVAHDNPKLQQLAATVQFTWPGAPSIYYGEELGMEGGADPDNRRGMEWQKATPDNSTLNFYKKLISIRNSNAVLQSGDPAILLVNDAAKTFAFSRTLNDKVAVVAVNRSESAQNLEIPLSQTGKFIDALDGKSYAVVQGKLKVQLTPLSSAILLPEK